jgi:hypothetical protein
MRGRELVEDLNVVENMFFKYCPNSRALGPSVRKRGSYTTKDLNITNENILQNNKSYHQEISHTIKYTNHNTVYWLSNYLPIHTKQGNFLVPWG